MERRGVWQIRSDTSPPCRSGYRQLNVIVEPWREHPRLTVAQGNEKGVTWASLFGVKAEARVQATIDTTAPAPWYQHKEEPQRWSSEGDCELDDLWAEGDDWDMDLDKDAQKGQRRG
eukprot:5936392-Amphidinium_carterae.3